MFKLKLHWQILIALVLAVVAGLLTGRETDVFNVSFFAMYDFVGDLFLNALKLLIVPLVMSSIICGIAGIGSGGALGRLGGMTFAYYILTGLIATFTGLVVVNLISPGIVDGEPAREILGLSAAKGAAAAEQIGGRSASDLTQVFLDMVPPNIVEAAANGQLLGLITFSLLFGYFMTRIEAPFSEHLWQLWQGIFQVMMRITDLVMKFAPLGVFALVAKVVAGIDADELAGLAQTVGLFFVSVMLALAFHAVVTLPALLFFVGRVNPWRHYRAMATALLTAFSTASSSATLPVTMECVEKNAGVSNRISSFVLPLGATVNMNGTALYECVAAIFIAQAYGLELTFATQFTVVLIALLTSIGVAGIPAASLVAIAIIMQAIGLPLEAIGVILAVDRILDMFRTALNVFGDTCAAVVIARHEGEEGILQDMPEQAALPSESTR
ncbi:MAG: dicarboxylate/amino acid:cation symporter [Gammaproteobacteria bacterium]|nr:dicarboxylate/amino acid:cation symporter [Gammaproteobacteria bacterium]